MDVSEPNEAITAALCVIFKVTRSEAHMLALLLADGYGAKEDLRARESALVGRTVTDNTVQTIICTLRRKLNPHGVVISTIPRMGYALDPDARRKIRSALVRYGFAPNRPSRPKPKTPEPLPDACAS